MDSQQNQEIQAKKSVDSTGIYFNPEKDTPTYKMVVDGALKELMEFYNAKENENGWKFVGNIKGVEVLRKPASPDFSIWDCSKGTIEINVPLHFLLSYLDNFDNVPDHDEMFDAGEEIEVLGGLTKVIYLKYKGIWPVSPRDFCSISAVRVLQDGTVTFFTKHVEHHSCPPCKKYVRGSILIAGVVLKVLSEDPPRIMSTNVAHFDLKGSVPATIINMVTANQGGRIGLIKEAVEKMYNEELDNPDRAPSKFKKDALEFAEKVKRAREVMAN
ncbi:stAR-related lipid transfer protein 5-like [Dendronephthya gigantea]|uniref:stAR-related lipid transfer protein 5-like n=1 Tax=Dendronephthya gigantea TaxID=151771 RepID=UPI00106BF111|nr:stAR-related lipid transfer protein 5-like [Dendronephthya gigantea]